MGTNEYSQPASKSSWDSQDFGDVNMVLKMAHFHKSSWPQWVKYLNQWSLIVSWINADSSVRLIGTNFNEILIKIPTKFQ